MTRPARELKSNLPPLFTWVMVRALENPVLGFSYIDRQAGPSVKGTPLEGDPTPADAKLAIEAPTVTVRMGPFPYTRLTPEQAEALSLSSPPPWYWQFFDDGTHALFANPDAGSVSDRSAGASWHLRVRGSRVSIVEESSAAPGNAEAGPGDPTTTAKIRRWLRGTAGSAPGHGRPRRSDPVPRPSLDAISERGRLIARLDRVAAWGTDALMATDPDRRRLGYYISYRQEDQWRVAFGRMAEGGGCFETAYEAVGNGPLGWPFDVHVFDPVREDRGWLRSAGQAIALSLKNGSFHSDADSYNCVVVPEFDGSNSAYWFPASRTPGVDVLGADFKVTVTAAGEASVVRFHGSLLKSEPGYPLMAHTHLLVQGPVSMDVAYVLSRRPPVSTLIVCEGWCYFAARDGTLAAVDLDRDDSITPRLMKLIEDGIEQAREQHRRDD